MIKKLHISILLLLAHLLCLPAMADDNKLPPPSDITLLPKGKGPRPGAPSTIHITASLSYDILTFTLPDDADSMDVYFGDEYAPDFFSTVTHEDPAIDVSHLHGTYEITCRTDGNQVFGGEITLP